MRKILFAVIMAAGVGLVGTSASAAPGAPIRDGLTNANVQEAQYYGYRRHRRHCTRVRVCDSYGYCRWRTRCW
ncbi:MAG: hypothetical protein JWN71_1819 [Xanthobacteraceae bacterium]|jgi:hypothetical protein|nr:hypothetical protein [Xanthobacteraceae bacterium]